MNWVLMLAAMGLSGFIGAAVPTLFFGQPFLGAWSIFGMILGGALGVVVHSLIKKTGYI